MAGTWERRGTVTVTRDSKIVTGVGTYWTDAKNGPQIGNAFYGPNGQAHEVALIKSATELWLADEYKGATESGVKYQIDTTRVDSVPGLASRVAAVIGYAQGQYDNLDKWTQGGVDEDVTMTSPNGESVTVPSLPKMGKNYTAIGNAVPAAERAEAAAVRAEEAAAATSADRADVAIKAGQVASSANAAAAAENTAVSAADTATQKAASAATHDASAQDAAARAENAASAVVGAVLDGGECDLSSGTYPSPVVVGGTSYSTVWFVAVAGTVSGVSFEVGDLLRYTTANSGYYFKVDAKDDVYSVKGEKGAVTVTPEKIGAEPAGVAQQLVNQHAAEPGAHPISGVDGLPEALAGKEATGAASSAVTLHEGKASAHPISGVGGLQEKLADLAAGMSVVEGKVSVLEQRKSTCLVNATGTGAPHETVATQLPANITNNSRYVLPNPFGNNTPVICWAEIFANGKWSRTGFVFTDSNVNGLGTDASYVQGEGIVVQTGGQALLARSPTSGSGHGITTSTVTSAPCRVFVRKLEA